MNNQTKILIALTVIAAIVVGWYAWTTLPKYISRTVERTGSDTPRTVRILPTDPVRGNAGATKTIIEFGDLECPACAILDSQISALLRDRSDIRLVWKDCPSSAHPNAQAAAEAAHCAGNQGKYWEYRDLLIANQDRLEPSLYQTLAASLKLNAPLFSSCLANGEKVAQMTASINECINAGVIELPGFSVNGKTFSGSNANIIYELTTELSKQ